MGYHSRDSILAGLGMSRHSFTLLRMPLRIIACALLLVLINACAVDGPSQRDSEGTGIWTSPLPALMAPEARSAEAREYQSRDQDAIQAERDIQAAIAQELLLSAETADPLTQPGLLLAAAEAAQKARRNQLVDEALRRLDSVDITTLNDTEHLRLTLLRAEQGAYTDRPTTLLRRIPEPDTATDDTLAARMWRLRAQAYLAQGDTLAATQALVRREARLGSPQAIAANRQLIWHTLRSVPPNPDRLALGKADRMTRGWVSLAQIMLDIWLEPDELSAATQNWERQYPEHPARQAVLSTRSSHSGYGNYRIAGDGQLSRIALLLPLSGAYSAPATAIRDGFMVAYYARAEPRPDILVYDTGGNPDNVVNQARQAVAAGAEMIVGPLTKDAVAEIAYADLDVPTLTLNYLEGEGQAADHVFQFGLSPEDEARQAAARAVRDGRWRALALVPQDEWGLRILTAFNDELYRWGGAMVEYAYFNPAERDFSAPITQLLRYDAAKAAAIDKAQRQQRRQSDSEAVMNEAAPLSAIREDFDFIFLAAKPAQARLLRPQLRFYRASGIPVYATSHVYTGNLSPQQDLDLDGIQFGDTPWTLAPAGLMAEARDRVARLWPAEHARYPRLYALGYDAYGLAAQLATGHLRGGFGYPGATGLLSLQANGRISRGLQWARFAGGKPHLLSDSPAGDPGYPGR